MYWLSMKGIWHLSQCLNKWWLIQLRLLLLHQKLSFNTLRPRQNGRSFADDTFKRTFLNENVRISIKISLKFVPRGPINNNPSLVQIIAWRRSGDKPLFEPMMVSLLTHICITRPQWVKTPEIVTNLLQIAMTQNPQEHCFPDLSPETASQLGRLGRLLSRHRRQHDLLGWWRN